jgi:hypothetical protein
MKKLLFIAIAFCAFTLSAQDGDFDGHKHFKIGAHIGIPTSDASDIYSVEYGADAYFMFGNIDSWVNLGATAGFRNFVGDEIDVLGTTIEAEDVQFLPVGGAARVKLFGIVEGGVDAGYAISLTDGVDGALWFRPVVGIDVADTIEIFVAHDFVLPDGGTIGSLQGGILIEL